MNPENKSLVSLFSEPNFLAISILENLLANNCFVNIFTSDTKSWLEKTSHIVAKNKFSIGELRNFQKNINYGYTIFSSGFLSKEKAVSELKKFFDITSFTKTKTLLIFPKEIYGILNTNQFSLSENIGIIYVGDLLGPRMDLISDLKISNYLNQIVSDRNFVVPVGEIIYPLFVSDVARQITKWLFAFGPFGKEIFILGPDVSSTVFWQANAKLVGDIKYQTDEKTGIERIPKTAEIFRMDRGLTYCLTETYKWLIIEPVVGKTQIVKKPQKIITSKTVTKAPVLKKTFNLKFILLPLLVLLLLPFLTLIINGGILFLSYKEFRIGNTDFSVNLLYAGKLVSEVGYYESSFLKYIPIAGQIYKETKYASYTSREISEIGIDGVPLVKRGEGVLDGMLGNKLYSISDVLGSTEDNLQSVYRDISNFQEYTTKNKDDGSILAKYVLSKVDIGNYKKLVYQLINIENKLPDILGANKSKTYLVLFENNTELRPTGGFIGSYGLLTLDGGRLSDFTISDIYSADGQLNGHVEPPAPIKQYLGEANWWFRDSNWDPDFPTSAKRAEWFLGKETDKQVDGVISIDLNLIKDFIKINGPMFLSDYNMDITSDNLYDKVQSEVQNDFFPGTYRKASFLTSLSRNILNEVGSLSSSKKVSLMKLVYENLEQKHIQIFLHDGDLQKAMADLNWDGSVFVPACTGQCFSDMAGIVEANVGVNKSNYFVSRDVLVDAEINGDEVKRTLTLTLKNSANINLGVSGRYKSYVRLLIPEDSTNVTISSIFGQDTKSLSPEITVSKGHMEVGTLIEVLGGGETKQLVFSWTGKSDSPFNQYSFYLRKQPGVEDYPVSIKIRPSVRVLGSNPAFTLTNDGNYVYNTTLVRDLFTRLSF